MTHHTHTHSSCIYNTNLPALHVYVLDYDIICVDISLTTSYIQHDAYLIIKVL